MKHMLHILRFYATYETRTPTPSRTSLLQVGFPCCDDIDARNPAPHAAHPMDPTAPERAALAGRGGGDRGRHRRLAVVERAAQSLGPPHLDRLRLPRPRGRHADRRQLDRL